MENLTSKDFLFIASNLDFDGDNRTGGEVKGNYSYNYAAVLGATAELETAIYPAKDSGSGIVLEKYLPHLTVNKETSYTDTEGWSIGGGVALKGEIGGSKEKGLYGSGGLDVSFNWEISHQTTKQWTVTDYEYVPVVNNYSYATGLANPMFTCKSVVTWPDYEHKKGWTISTAARSSVIQDMECIWSVPKENADKFKLTGQTSWKECFGWAHDWPEHCSKTKASIQHYGGYVTINSVKPAYMALEGSDGKTPVLESGQEGGMDYVTVHSESAWTASSDSDWLTLGDNDEKTASVVNGDRLYYMRSENTTGKRRSGKITIKSNEENLTLQFVQSPYSSK